MLRTLRPLVITVALVPLLATSVGGAQATPAPVVFAAPAGTRLTGPMSLGRPFDRVLPSGRIVHPAGVSVVVGMNAIGEALTPNGRFAIVTNDDERQALTTTSYDGLTTGGYSLAVVDTSSMRVVDRYREANESFFAGIVALADPANPANVLVLASGGGGNVVYALDLDATGRLSPDARPTIAIPGPTDPQFANVGHAFPGTIVLSPTGAQAYVLNNLGNDVAQIDTAARALVGTPVPVGYFPFGAAYSRAGLLVANEGLLRYGRLAAPTLAPQFASPAADLVNASSVSYVTTHADGSLGPVKFSVPLDRGPDGIHEVGGTHPSAIVALRRTPYAFVAMSNVDRIATLSLRSGLGRAVGGTELRLYDRGPYGTQPVALAGIDAIAVLDIKDPLHPHRIGLIPTGWYPSALAVSRNGRYLFVANAKGYDTDPGFTGDRALVIGSQNRVETVGADSNAVWSTLERIDLGATNLRRTTPLALANLRAIHPVKPNRIVPQVFGGSGSGAIKHVVFILEENKTYDSMLGDLEDSFGRPHGPGDPNYVAFDESVTPNLHALAREFGVAGNYYADAEESDAGHQFAAGGIASAYTERTLLVKSGRRPLVNKNEDPEDYPRAGYVFNSLALRGLSYRDYGDLVRVSGYDEGEAADPKTDDANFTKPDDTTPPTSGLGGVYALDVPAPLSLLGHIDLNYPGWNLRIRDVRRAAEFERDFDPLVRADAMPAFTYIWLPADHGGAGPNIPALPEEVADGDRALGQIVDYLTHIPQWNSTAIFITPDDAQSTRDHIDVHRSYAVVVSPYARRGYVGVLHTSTVSILKTEEELLGLPALSLGDALSTDFSDFFANAPNLAPYQRVDVKTQTASVEGRRIAALLTRTDQSSPDADDRGPTLIGLAREADRVAARRATYGANAYRAAQAKLYREARYAAASANAR